MTQRKIWSSEELHPLIDKFLDVRAERDKTYNQETGTAKTNGFAEIADLWASIIRAKYGIDVEFKLDGHDVCLMMAALKLWRAARAPSLEDSYVDAMNYVVLAKECLDAQTASSNTD